MLKKGKTYGKLSSRSVSSKAWDKIVNEDKGKDCIQSFTSSQNSSIGFLQSFAIKKKAIWSHPPPGNGAQNMELVPMQSTPCISTGSKPNRKPLSNISNLESPINISFPNEAVCNSEGEILDKDPFGACCNDSENCKCNADSHKGKNSFSEMPCSKLPKQINSGLHTCLNQDLQISKSQVTDSALCYALEIPGTPLPDGTASCSGIHSKFTIRRSFEFYFSSTKKFVRKRFISVQSFMGRQDSTVEIFSPSYSLCSDGACIRSASSRIPISFQDVSVAVAERSSEEKILALCDQADVIEVEKYFTDSTLSSLVKIGEGSFGEVFKAVRGREDEIAVKVVPVGGRLLVNGSQQLSFSEILSEMVITRKLSSLAEQTREANGERNSCAGFIRLHKMAFCRGSYPKRLVKLWHKWCDEKGSENDSPEMFETDQHYVIFETIFGGVDLEHATIKTLKEARSVLHQVTASLAVAEADKFEHRDLHWGNVLVRKTRSKTYSYTLNGRRQSFESHGIAVAIIDFTLSRLTSDDCTIFTDLSEEASLFQGEGDIQFDVYRRMKEENGNDWESFKPHTNVLWIQYLTEKMVSKMKSVSTLKKFAKNVTSYKSAEHLLSDPFLLHGKL